VISFPVCSWLGGILRKSSAQARIKGWDPNIWGDDDYAVIDDTKVGLILAHVSFLRL
jgi:hypothetical protein